MVYKHVFGGSYYLCPSHIGIICTLQWLVKFCTAIGTRSVAARFGRHGMPPLASNDTAHSRFHDDALYKSTFYLQHRAKMAQTDHVTLRPLPLTLEVITLVADERCRSLSVYQFEYLTVRF